MRWMMVCAEHEMAVCFGRLGDEATTIDNAGKCFHDVSGSRKATRAISTGERHHRADVVAFPETCNRPHYDYNLDDFGIWNVLF
jgi:hypothetical protein